MHTHIKKYTLFLWDDKHFLIYSVKKCLPWDCQVHRIKQTFEVENRFSLTAEKPSLKHSHMLSYRCTCVLTGRMTGWLSNEKTTDTEILLSTSFSHPTFHPHVSLWGSSWCSFWVTEMWPYSSDVAQMEVDDRWVEEEQTCLWKNNNSFTVLFPPWHVLLSLLVLIFVLDMKGNQTITAMFIQTCIWQT